ncbi:hypothetical protein DUI87_14334 [Hirundo rustica rustica]|uniref:Uncharacterized protein n=1 Tax=Hirundo rustica rustica TaxID=333673 RepID=A0A3M0K7Z7_HIRRU|nr:hypothetical protein DUI87_14334 [Hirundo rustica rustica]
MFGRCPSQERATNAGVPPQPVPEGSQELQDHLRGFLQGSSLEGTPPKGPSGICHLLSSTEPQPGLDAAAQHIWEPEQQGNSCKRLDGDKNATLERSAGLDVQKASKTPDNRSVCGSSQTKHG